MRKTKIVCTLGPSTDDQAILRNMLLSGMNVARINCSHGDYQSHKQRIDAFKKLRDELNVPAALLLDTKGPEVRVRTFENKKATLTKGQMFTLTSRDVVGNNEIVSITYKKLPYDLNVGIRILLDDGNIEMHVKEIVDTDIICEVVTGGVLSDRKSINIPGVELHMPYMSDYDKKDVLFGIENDVDFIAASFVRRADDVLTLRKFLNENGGKEIEIISKIENRDGVNNIDSIIEASNGIMVARGDMGVEIDFEELPLIQKMLIKKCYSSGKRVITATQMLESMISHPRPTRAETSDVANAVYDGTSAVMLSGETAAGEYPVEAVKTMARIARTAEFDIDYKKRFRQNDFLTTKISDAISHAACTTAHDLDARAILVVTNSGLSARSISKFKPNAPIIAATTSEKVYRKLALSWGVYPMMAKVQANSDVLFEHAIKLALDHDYIHKGDTVVMVAGTPLGVETNTLKVQVI